ncbi:hypothetical protein EGW08_021725, partial [Elysia chlorotica]
VHQCEKLVVVDEEVLLCENSLDVIAGQVTCFAGVVLAESCVEVAVAVADFPSRRVASPELSLYHLCGHVDGQVGLIPGDVLVAALLQAVVHVQEPVVPADDVTAGALVICRCVLRSSQALQEVLVRQVTFAALVQ